MTNILLFEEYIAIINGETLITESEFFEILEQEGIITEGAIKQILGWTLFPVISYFKYRERTKAKKDMIKIKLAGMEDGQEKEKEKLTKKLSKLNKDDLARKLEMEAAKKAGEEKAKKAISKLNQDEKEELQKAKKETQEKITKMKNKN